MTAVYSLTLLKPDIIVIQMTQVALQAYIQAAETYSTNRTESQQATQSLQDYYYCSVLFCSVL